LTLGPSDPIRIVHFSDMQFGGYDNWRIGGDAAHCATAITKQWKGGPSFIAITGDITEHGSPEEFDVAREWLRKLVERFGWKLPSPRILVVPGNHDVSLPLGASSELELRETSESENARKADPMYPRQFRVDFKVGASPNEALLDWSYRPYLEFAQSVSSAAWVEAPRNDSVRADSRNAFCWIEPRYRSLDIVFFGLNTARPAQPRSVSKRRLSKSAIESLMSACNEYSGPAENSPFFVGLTHHAPLGERQDKSVENPELLGPLFADVPRLGLWLHGHWHQRKFYHYADGTTSIVVSGAPSLTVREAKRPPNTLLGFSMLELARSDGRIISCEGWPVEWRDEHLYSNRTMGNKFNANVSG